MKIVSSQTKLLRKTEGPETLLAIFCLQLVLSRPSPAFLHRENNVVGNSRRDVVHIEICYKLKRSVQPVRSGLHPNVHISPVIKSAPSVH